MKFDKLYIVVLFTSAYFMVGCSEYEDTETTSPQADANAIGANFAKEMQSVKVTPDKKSFDIAMNRINPDGAKVIKVKTNKNTNNFCTPPAEFAFEEGKTTSKQSVSFDIRECTFQKPDTVTLKIDADAKDHIYGDGFLQTSVAMVVDYTWKDSIKTTAKDNYISSDAFPVTVQVATDYDKDKNKSTTLVRLPDYFKNAGKTTTDGAAHIQFVVNNGDRKDPKLIWDNDLSSNFGGIKFNTDEIETGIPYVVNGTGDKKDKTYDVYMRGLDITVIDESTGNVSTTATEDSEEATVDVTYKLTYELYYKDGESNEQIIAPVKQTVVREETTPAKYSSVFTIKFPKAKDTPATTE